MNINNMLNIKNLDIENEIKEAITFVKKEYKDLTDKQTCRFYSGAVYDELKSRGVLSRLVDTSDLDSSYSHMFVLALDSDKRFLIDLTYNQFTDDSNKLLDLKEEGYTLLNDEKWEHYLNILPKNNNFSIDDAIYGKEKKSK